MTELEEAVLWWALTYGDGKVDRKQDDPMQDWAVNVMYIRLHDGNECLDTIPVYSYKLSQRGLNILKRLHKNV